MAKNDIDLVERLTRAVNKRVATARSEAVKKAALTRARRV